MIVAVVSLASAVVGCVPAEDPPESGPAALIDRRPAGGPSEVPSPELPLAPLARMVGGEWMNTATSGRSNYRTWHWGPGRHSLRVVTDGLNASGAPWRELNVFFWHPGRRQVCEFGASSFSRGILQGTITFVGERAQSDIELHQLGGPRRLRIAWEFDGPDRYRTALLETPWPGGGEYTLLVAWDFHRRASPSPPRSLEVEGASPSLHIRPLTSLLGTWEMIDGLSSRTVIEWFPSADVLYARIDGPEEEGASSHRLDAYLYHHTGLRRLRCLALSSTGAVYEGDVVPLEGGGFRSELASHDGDRSSTIELLVEVEDGTALRARASSLDGDARTELLDLRAVRRPRP